MNNLIPSIPDQITTALDGRTQRWLCLEVKMHEMNMSKRMNGHVTFTEEELRRIEERLKFKIQRPEPAIAQVD